MLRRNGVPVLRGPLRKVYLIDFHVNLTNCLVWFLSWWIIDFINCWSSKFLGEFYWFERPKSNVSRIKCSLLSCFQLSVGVLNAVNWSLESFFNNYLWIQDWFVRSSLKELCLCPCLKVLILLRDWNQGLFINFWFPYIWGLKIWNIVYLSKTCSVDFICLSKSYNLRSLLWSWETFSMFCLNHRSMLWFDFFLLIFFSWCEFIS